MKKKVPGQNQVPGDLHKPRAGGAVKNCPGHGHQKPGFMRYNTIKQKTADFFVKKKTAVS